MSRLRTPEPGGAGTEFEAAEAADNVELFIDDLEDFDFDPGLFGIEEKYFDFDEPELEPSPSLTLNQVQEQEGEGMEIEMECQLDENGNANYLINDADPNKDSSFKKAAKENELDFIKKDVCWGQVTSTSSSGKNLVLSRTSSTSSLNVDLKFYADADADEDDMKVKFNGSGEVTEKQKNIIFDGEHSFFIVGDYSGESNVVIVHTLEIENESSTETAEISIEESNSEMYDPASSVKDNLDDGLKELAEKQDGLEIIFDDDEKPCYDGTSTPQIQDPTYSPTTEFINVNTGKKNSTTTSTPNYSKYLLKNDSDPMLNAANDVISYDPRVIMPLLRHHDAVMSRTETIKQFPKPSSSTGTGTGQIPRILNKRKSSHSIKQDIDEEQVNIFACTNLQANKVIKQEVGLPPVPSSAANNSGEKDDVKKKEERKRYATNYRKNKKIEMKDLKDRNSKLTENVRELTDEVKELTEEVKELKEKQKNCNCQPGPAVEHPSKKRKKSTK